MMKRMLMLCFLLVVAFANVEAAKAAPLAFGAGNLDDQKTLLENLNSLLPAGAPQAFMDLGPEAVKSIDPAYVALIGASQAATTNSIQTSFWVISNSVIADSYDMQNYWTPANYQYALSDIAVGWNAPGKHWVSLLDIVNGNVAGVSVRGAYFYGESLVYQPEGFDAVVFAGGTIFIGLDLGLGNKVDAILAFSPAPINAVPVPAAVWLLGSGLAGVLALRKRLS